VRKFDLIRLLAVMQNLSTRGVFLGMQRMRYPDVEGVIGMLVQMSDVEF
jgi:hypothetical protein